MSKFKEFKVAVHRQMTAMSQMGHLFRTSVTRDDIWDMYLGSFPQGSNPIFRERTEHDCACCRQFIKDAGNMVALIDNKKVSIWDIEIGGDYQVVADALALFVKKGHINDMFTHYQNDLGTDHNVEALFNDDMTVRDTITWDHFHYKLDDAHVFSNFDKGPLLSVKRSTRDVFKNSLEEINFESIETVIDLINQKSLYKGDEYLHLVKTFFHYAIEYDHLESDEEKDNFTWNKSFSAGASAGIGIKSSAIGTLLINLTKGVDLETAVGKFEAMVAPQNYNRPTKLVSASMIKKAQERVYELGLEDALLRRYALVEDITINNVLFADRETRRDMFNTEVQDAFGSITPASSTPINFSKVEEIGVNDFMDSVLPKIESMELLLENKHQNNLMSLIAPSIYDAPLLFKWPNAFSWAYNGEVTDSIRERVKKAGGSVTGDMRCSLSWSNYDDLDIHAIEPDGSHIYHGEKKSLSGHLDVDMNVHPDESREAVENIVWAKKHNMVEGIYKIYVNNYNKRESIDVGFTIEMEFDGMVHTFNYPKLVKHKEKVHVVSFSYSHNEGFKIIESLPSTMVPKEMWGINSQQFQKVTMLMNSPNYWDDNTIGNKHWFFILENCKNDARARGFFNEFLRGELKPVRKVFEVLGSKMKVENSDHQLSGLGFSSTQRNSVIVKVSGSFTRMLKINF